MVCSDVPHKEKKEITVEHFLFMEEILQFPLTQTPMSKNF